MDRRRMMMQSGGDKSEPVSILCIGNGGFTTRDLGISGTFLRLGIDFEAEFYNGFLSHRRETNDSDIRWGLGSNAFSLQNHYSHTSTQQPQGYTRFNVLAWGVFGTITFKTPVFMSGIDTARMVAYSKNDDGTIFEERALTSSIKSFANAGGGITITLNNTALNKVYAYDNSGDIIKLTPHVENSLAGFIDETTGDFYTHENFIAMYDFNERLDI